MNLLFFICKDKDITLYCSKLLKGLNHILYVKKFSTIPDTFYFSFIYSLQLLSLATRWQCCYSKLLQNGSLDFI